MINFKTATFGELEYYFMELRKKRAAIEAAMLHNQNEINKTEYAIDAIILKVT